MGNNDFHRKTKYIQKTSWKPNVWATQQCTQHICEPLLLLQKGPGHLVENGLSTFICMTLNSSEDKIQRGTIKILDSSKWSTRKSFMNHTLQKHKLYVKMMFWGIHIFIVFDCLWICLSHSDFPFLSVNYVFSASPASELGGEWYSRSRKLSLF